MGPLGTNCFSREVRTPSVKYVDDKNKSKDLRRQKFSGSAHVENNFNNNCFKINVGVLVEEVYITMGGSSATVLLV